MNQREFLAWMHTANQRVSVLLAFVDMAGDLAAGVLLSQIVYWHTPTSEGQSRLRVQHDGHYWLAKAHDEWWGECRLTAKQARRCIAALEAKGLIVACVWQFAGAPTTHVRLDWPRFLDAWEQQLYSPTEISICPPGQNDLPVGAERFAPQDRTITDTTAKTTTDKELAGGHPQIASDFGKPFPTSEERGDVDPIVRAWERAFGPASGAALKKIAVWEERFGRAEVLLALTLTATRKGHTENYTATILERRKEQGLKDGEPETFEGRKANGKPTTEHSRGAITDELADAINAAHSAARASRE